MVRTKALRDVTQEEINNFHRDGAVMLKGIMGKDWTEVLKEGLEFANDHPDGMSAGVSEPLRIDQWPATHSPKLKLLMDESPVPAIVGSVLNAPVRFYMDQMFYKPAGMIAPSAWHQDTCYYNVDGHELVRAWVCADPAPRDVSMEVIRGSHLWNVTYRPPVGLDPKDDPEGAKALEADFAAGKVLIGKEAYEKWTYFDSFLDPSLPVLPDIDGRRSSFDIMGWDYEPGDVLLFHGNILHSARGGVELPHPRRSHASLWAGPDVTYLRRRSQAIPDPLALYDFDPKDGQHLEEFPEVFPVAWRP
ncbi:MAG: ectoine hydroxylase-related dioxygenase (phytanoyl-CoA dioxygenase family) [Candidatus Azotimanducaceae bacterium]|jgi:ectoine hydroxylase-related dioxygenase (phytanoyl-CoA dioxygenase family)